MHQTPAIPTPLPHPAPLPHHARAPRADDGERARWLDLARALALAVVVLGHLLIAIVHRQPGGATQVTALLDIATWTHPLTWVLQVMPVFFAVGGYAAAASVRRRGVTDRSAWAHWMGRRAAGLIGPALPLLLVWLVAAPLLAGVVPASLVATASSAALVPLWFLATYLLVQAAVPMWVAVVERGRGPAALAALVTTAALVDLAHLQGVPHVGHLNFVVVWSVPTLLGVHVQAGRRALPLWPLIAAALAGAVALVVWAGYVVPVVGVTGSARSNNSPPSLLLALHGLAYAALVLHLGPRSEAALARGRRPGVLRHAARWSMPVYLWHMTGLVVVAGVLLHVDVPLVGALVETPPLTPLWWLLRPATIAAVLLVTALLIWATAPASQAAARFATSRATAVPWRVVTGLLGVSAGIAGLLLGGTVAEVHVPAVALLGGAALLCSGPVAPTAQPGSTLG